MLPLVTGLLGFVVGAIVIFVVLDSARKQWQSLQATVQQIEHDKASVKALHTKFVSERDQTEAVLRGVQEQLDRDRASFEHERSEARQTLQRERAEAQASLDRQRSALDARAVSYDELVGENAILKRDLRNVDVVVRKLHLDRTLQGEAQALQGTRSRALAERYLSDIEKWVGSSINADNYAACKQRLVRAIEWSREIGFEVSTEREEQLLTELKADFEKAVRRALEREEQARIKAQIREEQQREREIQRELESLERERQTLKAALERALADTKVAHGQEIEQLRARLAEAEAQSQRTMARAEMTKSGHIYIISNIGSFGDSVFKIGMTRRLDPDDRIKELSDASVPFPFDVHMMVSSENAPALEHQLHQEFHKHRLNKVNPRKEFFKLDLAELRKFIESRHGQVQYVADPEALEYRQSLTMSEEDQEYIESVYQNSPQEPAED